MRLISFPYIMITPHDWVFFGFVPPFDLAFGAPAPLTEYTNWVGTDEQDTVAFKAWRPPPRRVRRDLRQGL